MEKNNVIVAVSGGPDSMYLLYKLLKDKSVTPIVAHVNYHLRDSSDRDQKIVEDFCLDNDIKFCLFDVVSSDWEKCPQKNKQSKARHIRYSFFLDVASKHNTSVLYTGHHLDDWIETAIMQEEKSDKYLYYGIKSNSSYKGLQIIRPLLSYYKDQIIGHNIKKNIPYGLDETNDSDLYKRNRVRKNLLFVDKKKKRKIVKHYSIINKSKAKLEEKTNNLFTEWKNNDYRWSVFANIRNEELKIQLIYKLLSDSGLHINITDTKLNGINEFLKTNSGGQTFRLMENIELGVNKGRIYIHSKNYDK